MQNCKHKDCYYRIKNNGNSEEMCNYAILTGQLRKCAAMECDKYKPKNKKVNRFNHFKEG